MRDYAKTGGKQGRPGYRTPSSYVSRKTMQLWRLLTRREVTNWQREPQWDQKQGYSNKPTR